jgi:hypothetical protein
MIENKLDYTILKDLLTFLRDIMKRSKKIQNEIESIRQDLLEQYVDDPEMYIYIFNLSDDELLEYSEKDIISLMQQMQINQPTQKKAKSSKKQQAGPSRRQGPSQQSCGLFDPDKIVRDLVDQKEKNLVYPENKVKKTELPEMLLVGEIAPLDKILQASLLGNLGELYRAGTHAEGTCLIHSFLISVSPTYRALSKKNRKQLGQLFRQYIGKELLPIVWPEIEPFIDLEDLYDRLGLEIFELDFDEPLELYKELFKDCSIWLGMPEWRILQLLFGYNIVIITAEEDYEPMIYCGQEILKETSHCPTIILINLDDTHYESIFVPGKYIFGSDDTQIIIEYYDYICNVLKGEKKKIKKSKSKKEPAKKEKESSKKKKEPSKKKKSTKKKK